jgi:Transposase IS116/IS110/IS902 family
LAAIVIRATWSPQSGCSSGHLVAPDQQRRLLGREQLGHEHGELLAQLAAGHVHRRLTGPPPLASSGQVTRHRLNRSGDRQLNRALHTIVVARLRNDPATRAYAARRRSEGKSVREVRRCLKRAVARQLFKLLERCDRAGVEVIRAG